MDQQQQQQNQQVDTSQITTNDYFNNDEKPTNNNNNNNNNKDIEQSSISDSQLQSYQVIDNYFIENNLLKQKNINIMKIGAFYNNEIYTNDINNNINKSHKTILSTSDKNLILASYNENFLTFKSMNFNNQLFPYLQTAIKPPIDLLITMNNNTKKNYNNKQDVIKSQQKLYYYLYNYIINIPSYQEKINDFYTRNIKKNKFGLSYSVKYTLNKDIVYSSDYLDMIDSLSNWYTTSELLISNFYILEKAFNKKFIFNKNKFSIDNNYDWSINCFAKKNFLVVTSYILKNANLGIKLFGNFNYASMAFLMASSMMTGFSFSSVLFSNNFAQYALYGSIAFNWVLDKMIGRLDDYSSKYEFVKMTNILKKLNEKIEKIYNKSEELIKLCILRDIDVDNNETFNVMCEEFEAMIDKYLESVDDISPEEEKKLKAEFFKWEEEMVTIEQSYVSKSSLKVNNNNKDDEEKINAMKVREWSLIKKINYDYDMKNKGK